ncbi:MAG TPA: response regulator, partial [Longimicrobiales bacterium]|nr:response regulator [Longimicrobiales bacterium]
SLVTVRAVLADVAGRTVAVPSRAIVQVLRVDPERIRRVKGGSVLTTDDYAWPLMHLGAVLGTPYAARPLAGKATVLLLAAAGRRAAVVVDRAHEERELLLHGIPASMTPLPLVAGIARVAMGRMAPVLVPDVLVQRVRVGGSGPLATAERAGDAAAPQRILVVDDSITTRTLEQSLLEAAGYEVIVAVDGADAWRVLQEKAVALVVADVDMPRVDGFALCRMIRESRRMQDLPLVLVTALETPEHRARGMEVGADAYLGKSGFDQDDLLDTIRQLLGPGTSTRAAGDAP